MSNDKLKVWRASYNATLPERMTKKSVGYDLASLNEYTFDEGEFHLVETGLVVEPPTDSYIEVMLRSSLTKKGLSIPNGLGVIDPDYCSNSDTLKVPIAKNHKGKTNVVKTRGYGVSTQITEPVKINKGERIAQIIVRKRHLPDIEDMTGTENPNPERGGFGSTGRK